MRTAMTAFNSPYNDGRCKSVLLHLQHSFEMLLKAALAQAVKPVFDKRTGRSLSFEQSVRQSQQLGGLKLEDEEAGTLRAVDAVLGGDLDLGRASQCRPLCRPGGSVWLFCRVAR
jgi:hypothetical protein